MRLVWIGPLNKLIASCENGTWLATYCEKLSFPW